MSFRQTRRCTSVSTAHHARRTTDMTGVLEGKTAIVYGAGGGIGGAVSRAYGRQGATVALVGRTRDPLDAVARDIEADGGTASVAVLDALDEKAVDEHVADVVAAT